MSLSLSSEVQLDELYKKAAPTVYRRSLAILGNPDEALDAVQDVFLTLHQKLHLFRGDSDILTWIYRITSNHCLNRLRSKQTLGKVLEQVNQNIQPMDIHDLANAIERRDLIVQLVSHLNTRELEVLFHYHHDEMTQLEIAKLLNISERTVRTILKQALKIVTREGISLDLLRE